MAEFFETIPWEVVSNSGVGVALIVVVTLFLRYLGEERKDRASARREFTAALEVVTDGVRGELKSMTKAMSELSEEIRSRTE